VPQNYKTVIVLSQKPASSLPATMAVQIYGASTLHIAHRLLLNACVQGLNFTNVQRVAVVCEELGLHYNCIPVDFLNGEHQSSAYKDTLNPFSKVPVLVSQCIPPAITPYFKRPNKQEDGFQLYESRAISRYLVAKHGHAGSVLVPSTSDPQLYGTFEQAASIEYSSFEPSVVIVAWERIITK
jgi:glutathione S-transferase